MPRFAYKENENGEIVETAYIKEETTLGGEWIIPYTFIYGVEDETRPDFSLSGVWIEKDIDAVVNTANAEKIINMNKEESIYGFIANTKASRLSGEDRDIFGEYITNIINETSISEPRNRNRVILKIVDTNKVEPIKAEIKYNGVDKKIEIKVTYTANGISKILDGYGEGMTLTKENGIILADTGESTLGKGIHKCTIIDNKGNKMELSIIPSIDSLFKVAYINGIDNMNNTATYNKARETKTEDENNLINQLYDKLIETDPDSDTRYRRAITYSNQTMTVIEDNTRTTEDEQLYLYNKYNAVLKNTYEWNLVATTTGVSVSSTTSKRYGYLKVSTDASTGTVTGYNYYPGQIVMPGQTNYACYLYTNNDGNYHATTVYTAGSTLYASKTVSLTSWSGDYYKWYNYNSTTHTATREYYKRTYNSSYSIGSYIGGVVDIENAYTIGSTSEIDKDGYWYTSGGLSPKYTLSKYDADLNLKSTYDVDTKTLTTEGIDISNRGKNKVKLTLDILGEDYKIYISNDKTNWKEITDITSDIPKELDVDGWNDLYIKIETNSSTINNIDVAYYKD